MEGNGKLEKTIEMLEENVDGNEVLDWEWVAMGMWMIPWEWEGIEQEQYESFSHTSNRSNLLLATSRTQSQYSTIELIRQSPVKRRSKNPAYFQLR